MHPQIFLYVCCSGIARNFHYLFFGLEKPNAKKMEFFTKKCETVLEMEQHCTPFSKAEAITTNADHNMNIDGGLG